jgi:hypothetical protein
VRVLVRLVLPLAALLLLPLASRALAEGEQRVVVAAQAERLLFVGHGTDPWLRSSTSDELETAVVDVGTWQRHAPIASG